MPDVHRRLLVTLAALVVLTLTSWGFSSLPTGSAAPFIAFAIAIAKALLVVLVFMELGSAGTLAWSAVFVAGLLIVLLAAGAWSDVAFR
jgi:cytochrome c oxidase subunit 4